MYVTHVQCHWGPEKLFKSPGAKVTGGCELETWVLRKRGPGDLDVGAGDLGPLEEQQGHCPSL